MTLNDTLSIVTAVTLSFGGGAVIVIALSSWLGNIWAQRILQREHASLEGELEEIRHELNLAKSSYDKYLDLILDYYKMFYRHYRLCQETAHADAHRHDSGEVTFTKEEFLGKLDQFLAEWDQQEGKIRLLLPERALNLHNEAIEAFNRFKQIIDEYSHNEAKRKEKQDAFENVDSVKDKMESTLREFLRTEKLLK